MSLLARLCWLKRPSLNSLLIPRSSARYHVMWTKMRILLRFASLGATVGVVRSYCRSCSELMSELFGANVEASRSYCWSYSQSHLHLELMPELLRNLEAQIIGTIYQIQCSWNICCYTIVAGFCLETHLVSNQAIFSTALTGLNSAD